MQTRQVKTALVLLAGVFVGCASERLMIPPARAGMPIQRWEYACRSQIGSEDVEKLANEFGQQGWEMAAVATLTAPAGIVSSTTRETWCFKRPLP
jgi:hypothetical protein